MVAPLLRTWLARPAVADPPRRVWRDWVLLAIMLPAVVVEGIVSETATLRPASTLVMAGLVVLLLWRRTHPLAVMVIGFGSVVVAERISQAVTGEPFDYYTAAFLLLTPYAVFRWGSGRDSVAAVGVMIAVLVSAFVSDWTGIGDAIGGTLVLLFPAVLGVEVRHLVESRARDLDEVKAHERELLARELHDTVAHHVSAIAIRAQAGRVIGRNDPAGALDALAVIEREASRTLAEMRGIVGTLRGDSDAEFAPQPTLDDLQRLAGEPVLGDDRRLCVDVTMSDDVGDVGPTVGGALYRIAQEAVTNARRHARDATLVSIDVSVDAAADGGVDRIRLVVDDDGRMAAAPAPGSAGFGLVGMTERAHLLGGTLTAGPHGDGGWRVEAEIPRPAVLS